LCKFLYIYLHHAYHIWYQQLWCHNWKI